MIIVIWTLSRYSRRWNSQRKIPTGSFFSRIYKVLNTPSRLHTDLAFKSGCELWTTLWQHSNHFSAHGADSNGHQNLKEPSKPLKSLLSQRSAMVSKCSTQRNEPAYAHIGLVKASGTSCHRNIVRVTRVYLTSVRMVGESRWPDPDS